ncbi:hypothetical protein ACFL1Z_02140 [Thermodesulfobacteriota bacterium]
MTEDLLNFLRLEIIVIGNHQVTVGKLIMSLLVLVVGIIVVRISFHLLGSRFLSKTPLKKSTASAIEKMFTYFAYLLVLL